MSKKQNTKNITTPEKPTITVKVTAGARTATNAQEQPRPEKARLEKPTPAKVGQKDDGKSAAPARDMAPTPSTPLSKIDTVIALLRAKGGASIEQVVKATGWQAHSVRGAISGQLKKKLGLNVLSEKIDETRLYRIAK